MKLEGFAGCTVWDSGNKTHTHPAHCTTHHASPVLLITTGYSATRRPPTTYRPTHSLTTPPLSSVAHQQLCHPGESTTVVCIWDMGGRRRVYRYMSECWVVVICGQYGSRLGGASSRSDSTGKGLTSVSLFPSTHLAQLLGFSPALAQLIAVVTPASLQKYF